MSDVSYKVDPGEILELHLRNAHELAVRQAHEIAEKLKEEGSGMFLAQLYHDATLSRKQIIELAKALIPYRSPKLESIEVKQTVEHRFAIFSPEPIQKIGEFMDAVGKEQLPPVITRNSSKILEISLDTPNRVVDTSREDDDAPDDMYIMEP